MVLAPVTVSSRQSVGHQSGACKVLPGSSRALAGKCSQFCRTSLVELSQLPLDLCADIFLGLLSLLLGAATTSQSDQQCISAANGQSEPTGTYRSCFSWVTSARNFLYSRLCRCALLVRRFSNAHHIAHTCKMDPLVIARVPASESCIERTAAPE